MATPGPRQPPRRDAPIDERQRPQATETAGRLSKARPSLQDALKKTLALREAPGAKLVIADGFMKKSVGLPRWYAALLAYMNRSWAVERFADLAAFRACLERHGFTMVAEEEISWRIAPSVLHVPRVTLKFLLGELFVHRKKLTGVRWGHVAACLIAPLIGLGRSYFGYYLVTAEKTR